MLNSTLNCKFIQIAIINFSSSSFHLFLNKMLTKNQKKKQNMYLKQIKKKKLSTLL